MKKMKTENGNNYIKRRKVRPHKNITKLQIGDKVTTDREQIKQNIKQYSENIGVGNIT